MKNALNLTIAVMFTTALCLVACNHENGENNGSDTPEYPVRCVQD